MLETTMDIHLVHRAASAYYLDDLRQADVAERLGVSRPTVSKLLAEARRIGMVRFMVLDPGTADVEGLARRIEAALDLDSVHIAQGDQLQLGHRGLGQLVGRVLDGIGLEQGDVVLVSSGKTIYHVSESPALPPLPGVIIAPTVGGQQETDPWHQTNEIVRRFSSRTGASPRYLFAPAMPSSGLWESLQTDPSFAGIRELWSRARVVLLGIGGPTAQRNDIASVIPQDAPHLQSAAGDIALHFFDRFGAPVNFPGADRLVRLPLDLLERIPVSIAVAVGPHKATAITAAASVDLFRTLITDVPTAEAILDSLGERGAL